VIVDDVESFVRRFVILDDHEALMVTLWVIHTHIFERYPETPYLAITSPEKRCGKTQLMKVLALLSKDAWSAILPSEAVVYRKIDEQQPTLLLDETDSIFKISNGDKYEALRTLLNEGNHAGARVPRCLNGGSTIIEFSTFCPKALAGIGTLPDTVTDRSVPIRLERKAIEQAVERFRVLDVEPEGAAQYKKIVRWVKQAKLDLRPEMPDELNDRAQDICEPLVSIADACGCGDRAREALIALFTSERLDDAETMRITLLRDLKTIFDARSAKKKKPVTHITTHTLLTELCALTESPWLRWYGRQFNERDLAGMLRPFKIKSVDVRVGESVLKGYKRDDLYDVWGRYRDVIA
jgi:hypothetical protein